MELLDTAILFGIPHQFVVVPKLKQKIWKIELQEKFELQQYVRKSSKKVDDGITKNTSSHYLVSLFVCLIYSLSLQLIVYKYTVYAVVIEG